MKPQYCSDCGNPDCPNVSSNPYWSRCPAKASAPYVPRRGERIRVTAVCPADLSPHVDVGEEFEVAFARLSEDCADVGVPDGAWALVRRAGDAPGVSTWIHCEPLPPLDWTPPSERPTSAPDASDGIAAFEADMLERGEFRARLRNVARLFDLPPFEFQD